MCLFTIIQSQPAIVHEYRQYELGRRQDNQSIKKREALLREARDICIQAIDAYCQRQSWANRELMLKVLHLRFFEGRSLSEIGQRLGYTRSHIHHLENRILSIVRARVGQKIATTG